MSTPQLVIQTDGPFKVFCNSCDRWVEGARVNIDGTHDADESKPVRTGRGVPPPERTDHTVWEMKERSFIQEEQPTYTANTEWGDPMVGKPTIYTYTFSDGRIFQQEERKNIVTGGFNQKVTLTAADGTKRRSSLRDLREATKAAKEEL